MRPSDTIVRPVLAGCCLLALAGGLTARPGVAVDLLDVPPPSAAVYPPRQYPVRSEHALHAASIDCLACHSRGLESTQASQDLLPRMEECGECHDEVADTETPDACALCHEGYRPVWPQGEGFLAVRDPRFPLVGPEPVVSPPPNLIFSHQAHADVGCTACHSTAADGGASLPLEATCLDCHAARGATESCDGCHPSDDRGHLLTRLPGNRRTPPVVLRPRDHESGWDVGHALAASTEAQACFVCHSERDCLECHDGRLAVSAIHPPGFVRHHAFEARRDQPVCGSCHSESAFCIDCHVDARVVADETHRPPLGTRLHPEGWVGPGGGGLVPSAQRNLLDCASCHAESDCAQCHVFVNPHGPAFFERCGALLNANPSVCARCHEDTSRLGVGCE